MNCKYKSNDSYLTKWSWYFFSSPVTRGPWNQLSTSCTHFMLLCSYNKEEKQFTKKINSICMCDNSILRAKKYGFTSAKSEQVRRWAKLTRGAQQRGVATKLHSPMCRCVPKSMRRARVTTDFPLTLHCHSIWYSFSKHSVRFGKKGWWPWASPYHT